MGHKNMTRLIPVIICLLVFASCDQDNSDATDMLPLLASGNTNGKTVYTGGFYSSHYDKPCIWIGRNRIDLPNDPDNTVWPDNRSEVCGIYVYKGVVYSGGWFTKGGRLFPCYWTDTSMVPLPGDGIHDAEVNSIFVSEGVVYTGGYYNDGDKDIPCYWEGATLVPLEGDGVHDARVKSIFVSGGTVYSGGYYNDGSKSVPCYWADDVITTLPVDSEGVVNSIFVSGEVVYSGGWEYIKYSLYEKFRRACYWVGTTNVPVPVPFDTYFHDFASTGFYSIFVYDGVTYAGGDANYDIHDNYWSTNAAYWTGTTMTTFKQCSFSIIKSIYVYDGTVYSGGCGDYSDGEGGNEKPYYWIGKKRYNLPIPRDNTAHEYWGCVNSIFVVD